MTTLDEMLGDDDSITGAPQHVCVFGPPKVGKTQLIGKLALEGYKLIWFDGENGKSTLLKLPRWALENITYIGIKDTKDNPLFLATMDKVVKGGDFNICDAHGNVECGTCKRDGKKLSLVCVPTEFNAETCRTIVVADSLTQLGISINWIVTKGKPIDYQETLHDFRNNGNYLNRIFSYIQQAPYHFIGTAHEIEAEREDGSFRIVPSIGTKNYAINSAKFFDHVVYMDKKNMKHTAASSTTWSNNILTGSRTDIAVEKLAEPDLLSIFQGNISNAIPSNNIFGTKIDNIKVPDAIITTTNSSNTEQVATEKQSEQESSASVSHATQVADALSNVAVSTTKLKLGIGSSLLNKSKLTLGDK